MKSAITKTPIWFWFYSIPLMILGILGLLQLNSVWNDDKMTEPWWANLSYSLGILCILIGSVILVLRKRLAVYFFVISIFGFALHRTWVFAVSDRASIAPWTLFLPILFDLIAISIAINGSKKGWIV